MFIDLAIRGTLILLMYAGPLYCLYTFVTSFHDGTKPFDNLEKASRAKIIFVWLMLIFSLVGWVIFLQAGFERALFFLPWTAGDFDSSGEFEPYRSSASWVLAFWIGFSCHRLAYTILRRNNQRHQHIELLLQKGQRDLADWWLKC